MLFDQNHIGRGRIPSQGSLGSLSEGLEMVCVGGLGGGDRRRLLAGLGLFTPF